METWPESFEPPVIMSLGSGVCELWKEVRGLRFLGEWVKSCGDLLEGF